MTTYHATRNPDGTVRMTRLANQFLAGDIVRWKATGEIYKVLKVNPKNLRGLGTDGRTYNLNRLGAELADKSEWTEPETDISGHLLPGTAVRFKPGMGEKGVYIVAKSKGMGEYELVHLGGNSRYYPRAHVAKLMTVDEINNVEWI